MGLDIAARSHLKFLRPLPEADGWEALRAEYEEQGEDLDNNYFVIEPNVAGFDEHLAGIEPGIYRFLRASKYAGFRAGSYSYFNRWREHLCRLALNVEPDAVWKKPKKYSTKPFVELINFSDCQGVIGPTISEKLAGDFDLFAKVAVEYFAALEYENSFLETYNDFSDAFHIAAKEAPFNSADNRIPGGRYNVATLEPA